MSDGRGTDVTMANQQQNTQPNPTQSQSSGTQSQSGGNVRDTMRQFVDSVKADIQSLNIGEDVRQQLNTKLDQRLDEMGSKLG